MTVECEGMYMTLEELKKEADRLGYALVKKKPYQEKYLPCVCGCTCEEARFRRGMDDDGFYYRTCPKCEFTVRFHKDELKWPSGSWETKIKVVWNETIKERANETE